MPRTEEELLERVYRRSEQITRGRRARLAGIAGASLVALALAVALVPRDQSRDSLVNPVDEPKKPQATQKPVVVPGRPTETMQPDGEAKPVERPTEADGSGRAEPAPSACSPLVEDEIGDTKDRQLDIRSSSITYDEASELLTFTHRLRDLTGVYSSGDAREWDLDFTWAGERYTVRARHESSPTEASETFRVFRQPDSTGTLGEDTSTIAHLAGTIDNDTDLITIEMSLDDFNSGVSRDLTRGSRLTDIEMHTRTSKLATNDDDDASASCDYEIAERPS